MNRSDKFYFQISFEKNSENPERIFKTMQNLIEAIRIVNNDLLSSVPFKIDPVLTLSDVTSGSIKTWMRNQLKSIDEGDIRDLNIRRIIGGYLLQGVRTLIKSLEKGDKVISRKLIENTQQELIDMARTTELNGQIIYKPIEQYKVFRDMSALNKAIQPLSSNDLAKYGYESEDIAIRYSEYLAETEPIDIIGVETKIIENPMVLQIKKPDYLGNSKWEFRHGGRQISGKILDKQWLSKFQRGQIIILPGGAIKARVRFVMYFDSEGTLISDKYEIIEVLGEIEPRKMLDSIKLF